jgi:hypothetical protein
METKYAYQSKTIIGAIVALFSIIASSFFGFEINLDDKNQLTEVIFSLLGSCGALLAIYGRIKANKIIVNKQ